MPLFMFNLPNIEKMTRKKDIAGLIKALSYRKDFNVAIQAAKALGTLGDPQAMDPLIACFDDNVWILHPDELAYALALIDDPRVVEPLVNNFILVTDTDTKFMVIQTLSKFKHPRGSEELISMLNEKNDSLRHAAVKALIEIGDPSIAKQLAKILMIDKNWEKPRLAAAQVLVSLGAHAAKPLVASIGKERRSRDKIVLKTLVQIGSPAVDPLVRKLKNKQTKVKLFACRVLGEIGDPKAMQPLVDIVRDASTETNVRETAARNLLQFGWTPDDAETEIWYSLARRDWKKLATYKAAAVEPLLSLNEGFFEGHDEEEVPYKMAIKTLKKIGTPAVEPLITALDNDDWDVQAMAAAALGMIGDPKSVEPLSEAFKKSGWDDLDAFAKALKCMKVSLPQPINITAEAEKKALNVLNRLCAAYAINNRTVISKLQPQGRKIGEEANQRGGLMEMRRLFKKLKKSPGQRNLEFFWGGIGQWRG